MLISFAQLTGSLEAFKALHVTCQCHHSSYFTLFFQISKNVTFKSLTERLCFIRGCVRRSADRSVGRSVGR